MNSGNPSANIPGQRAGKDGARPHPLRTPLLVVGLGLTLNAALLLLNRSPNFTLDARAFGQAAPGTALLGARGLFMMPAQIGPNSFGCYLMDVDSQTISVYKVDGDRSRLKLIAARTFGSDRFLTDLNNESPTPKDTAKLVRQQREREEIERKPDPVAETQPGK